MSILVTATSLSIGQQSQVFNGQLIFNYCNKHSVIVYFS